MRRVRNSNGWEEITTVNIDITHIYRNFSSNEDWNRIHEERPKLARGRKTCKCCGSKWVSNGSDIALAFTSKGNKIICNSCTDYFEDKGIKIYIPSKNEK